MRALAFLKSPTGNLALFLGFVTVGGLLLYQSNAWAKAQAGQMTKVEAAEQGGAVASITRIAANRERRQQHRRQRIIWPTLRRTRGALATVGRAW
jgi:hypothetical protein